MKEETYPDFLIKEYESLMNAYPEHPKLREEVSKILNDNLEEQDKVIILDIGCGSGETTKYILKESVKAKVIAIDNDKRMIDRLKDTFNKNILKENLEPICQDIFNYIENINDSFFDAITSSWTIHNFKKGERNKLLKEIYRTLQPGGIFVNMDKYVFDDAIKEKESFDEAVKKLSLVSNEKVSLNAIKHEDEDRHPEIIMKEKESALEMETIGFRKIVFHTRIGREVVMSCFK
ncbi:MAG: class I SAM-dependent methyltransferase [Nanoarchaeota archaeon]|jgi:tRNA (cmo5U34)-methyltransferase|nr:class I SAM-dependent methyltransferase [Nanoarchaeota archaeon]